MDTRETVLSRPLYILSGRLALIITTVFFALAAVLQFQLALGFGETLKVMTVTSALVVFAALVGLSETAKGRGNLLGLAILMILAALSVLGHIRLEYYSVAVWVNAVVALLFFILVGWQYVRLWRWFATSYEEYARQFA